MSAWACVRMGVLLDGRAAGLTTSQRLMLEQHLQGCRACAQRERALSAAADLFRRGAAPLAASSPRTTEAAIDTALRAAAEKHTERRAAGRARWLLLPALAAVFVLAVWFARPGREQSVPERPQSAAVAQDDVVLSGQVSTEAEALAPGGPLPAERSLTAHTPATLRVGHALAELTAGSIVRWQPGRSVLVLESGRARLNVDPKPQRPFAVEASDFRVEALGTRFEVWPEGVVVQSGRVRVTSPSGVQVLAAGASWTRAAPPRSPEPTADLAVEQRPTRANAMENLRSSPARTSLVQARARLAEGDASGARRDIQRALGSAPTSAEDAEARSLLAECSIVEGNSAEAQRRYAEVARQHAGTPAGETALFAAARLESKPSRARTLLEEYLRRYPHGRFRAEAEARLRDGTPARP